MENKARRNLVEMNQLVNELKAEIVTLNSKKNALGDILRHIIGEEEFKSFEAQLEKSPF